MKWPVFRHEAMATYFELTIAGHEVAYARQAAAAAFRELDRLEGELSRFVESSDIARANRLACGEIISIGHDAFECLLIAADASLATGRAFDPAYASEFGDDVSPPVLPFTLDPTHHQLTSHVKRLHLDLGAVGKGYALDRLAETLRDWQVTSACLDSGGSTALALASPPGSSGWMLGLGGDTTHRSLPLSHAALSGSGTAVKGLHLIDPHTGNAAERVNRAWALAPTAALADALSTAFFVMPDEAIAQFCKTHPEIGAATMPAPDRLVAYGRLRVSDKI